MRTSNPALRESVFNNTMGLGTSGRAMTINGTVQKTMILLALLVIAAGWTWSQIYTPGGAQWIMPIAFGGMIGGFIVAMVTIFKPSASPYTAPVYAVLEGLTLGAISAIFNVRYPGIVIPAIGLTFGTLGALLLAYQTGIIRVTEPFRRGVIAATGGIALFYLVIMGLSFFGIHPSFYYGSGLIGIGISLFVVVVAAANLVLDFDLIERSTQQERPAYMEWYCGFSLLVTLVWLYLEILRLLARLNNRR